MQLNTLLAILPLPERVEALAALMGERLRAAYYSPAGDAGAVAQNVNLDPPSNEGPYVITGMKFPVTGNATLIRWSLNANGTQYVPNRNDGVMLTSFPATLPAPIVVMEAGRAAFRLVAGAGAHGTIRAYFSGFHCTERFALALREMGELWADQLSFATTDGAKQLPPMERNTLLDLLALPRTPTDVQLQNFSLRVHDVLVTPRDLLALSTMFSTASGLGRAPKMTDDVSGRISIRIPRGGVISARAPMTAGNLDLTFVGRRTWIG